MMWYVYILECQNKSLYTGVTDNVELRFERHQTGQGGHYTSYIRPKRILYKEEFKTLSEAKIREQQIKRWSKSKKLALIKGDRAELINLSKSRD
jgi:predicted GIY-YIG superfamily endonuclease